MGVGVGGVGSSPNKGLIPYSFIRLDVCFQAWPLLVHPVYLIATCFKCYSGLLLTTS